MPGVSLDIWDQPAPENNPEKNLRADPYMQVRSPQVPQVPQAPAFTEPLSQNPSQFPSWENSEASQKQQRLQNQYNQQRSQNQTRPTQAYTQEYSGPQNPEASANTGHPFAVNFQTVPQGPSRPSGPPTPPSRIPPGALRYPEPPRYAPSQVQYQVPLSQGVPIATTIQLPGWMNILFIVIAILLGIIVVQLFQVAQALRR